MELAYFIKAEVQIKMPIVVIFGGIFVVDFS
jgi:hypothetical protein